MFQSIISSKKLCDLDRTSQFDGLLLFPRGKKSLISVSVVTGILIYYSVCSLRNIQQQGQHETSFIKEKHGGTQKTPVPHFTVAEAQPYTSLILLVLKNNRNNGQYLQCV